MHLTDCFSVLAQVQHLPLRQKGEDAFAYSYENPDLHAIAVFDGCGGSGAWQYPEYRNASGAFVAAQTMAKSFLPWLQQLHLPLDEPASALADSYRACAQASLGQCKAKCKPMGVSGTLVKSFPCTASAAIMTLGKQNTLRLVSLNAGDSRVYFLTPESGLVQLTTDDSRGKPDPLESLRDSAPLSNMLNADNPFRVAGRSVGVPLPCAVLCATDGTFGFLRSPMDFEDLLLSTLETSGSVFEYEQALTKRIAEVTGDDSTLLCAFYGWQSFQELKRDFLPRQRAIDQMIRRLDAAGPDPDAIRRAIEDCWKSYRTKTVFDCMRGEQP